MKGRANHVSNLYDNGGLDSGERNLDGRHLCAGRRETPRQEPRSEKHQQQ
jgi:hypothetical protein